MQIPSTSARAAQPTLFDVPPPLQLEAKHYVPPAEQLAFWEEPSSVQLSQNPSWRTPDAASEGNGNCGPTSAVMALRLVGLDVPGFNGEDTQRAISAARRIATGANDDADWTNLEENVKVLEAGGAKVRLANGANDMLASVRDGKVALILGNNNTSGTWAGEWVDPTTDPNQWMGHFVVASRYYPDRDAYAVNDPGNTEPVFVSGDQLKAFMQGGEGHDVWKGAAAIVDGPATAIRPATIQRGDHGWPQPQPSTD